MQQVSVSGPDFLWFIVLIFSPEGDYLPGSEGRVFARLAGLFDSFDPHSSERN